MVTADWRPRQQGLTVQTGAAAYSGWLYERLVDRYPSEVFKDVDSIELGATLSR